MGDLAHLSAVQPALTSAGKFEERGRKTMGYNLFLYAWPLLFIVLGPLLAYNCLKALRAGEGMYDRDSTNYMLVGNWFGVLLGLAATAWSAWRLYQIISSL
jgi:hypothetical protein